VDSKHLIQVGDVSRLTTGIVVAIVVVVDVVLAPWGQLCLRKGT
jgi:hypothetical protein